MKHFVETFTNQELENTIQIGDRFFMLNRRLEETMKNNNLQPEYVGAYLGYTKNDKFVPSFILLSIIAKITERVTVINKKQEWLFTNNKDLNTKGKTGVKEGFVIVTNSWKEVLGLGEIKGNRLRNLADVGDFMRREH